MHFQRMVNESKHLTKIKTIFPGPFFTCHNMFPSTMMQRRENAINFVSVNTKNLKIRQV
jgi:hypothetical protein